MKSQSLLALTLMGKMECCMAVSGQELVNIIQKKMFASSTSYSTYRGPTLASWNAWISGMGWRRRTWQHGYSKNQGNQNYSIGSTVKAWDLDLKS